MDINTFLISFVMLFVVAVSTGFGLVEEKNAQSVKTFAQLNLYSIATDRS